MRGILTFLMICIISLSVKAQTYMPARSVYYMQPGMFGPNAYSFENPGNKKWFVSKYASLSSSYSFFKGGSASIISAPIGLQLNRRLNNNLYAFAGISAAPAYINFNSSFLSTDFNKGTQVNSMFRSNNFGMYSRAELGLMYVNDDKTFSISGSIGVQRSSYPVLPVQQPVNTTRPAHITRSNN